jgi:HSP20 family molecular chaperone IbpA
MAEEISAKTETKSAGAERTKDSRTYIPRVDIYETNESLYLLADMPGTDESRVNITLEKDILTIEAGVDQSIYGQRKATYIEYGIGDYYRQFTLSDEIDREKIEASMKDGVLKVVLPKAEPVKTRKIAIQAG